MTSLDWSLPCWRGHKATAQTTAPDVNGTKPPSVQGFIETTRDNMGVPSIFGKASSNPHAGTTLACRLEPPSNRSTTERRVGILANNFALAIASFVDLVDGLIGGIVVLVAV